MPNKKAKQRKMDRKKRNEDLKKWKRQQKRLKVVKVVQDDGHWYNKEEKK